jgi:DNA-binding HxlR family transcriptional regulator
MHRRSYNQYCGVAHSLDLVGERWTLLIVRNLLLGPQRYTELQRGLPGITTNLLAKRLKEMEEQGLIEPTQNAYRLTTRGAGLEPVVHVLGRWGWAQMGEPAKGEHRSFDYLMVALRSRYRGGEKLRAELVADGAAYRVVLRKGRMEISRGEVESPDVRLSGSGASLGRILLDESARREPPADVSVEGSPSAVRAFLGAFAVSD